MLSTEMLRHRDDGNISPGASESEARVLGECQEVGGWQGQGKAPQRRVMAQERE